jgi:60 kDa SS-A/Ro ribonucleoprotein
MFQNYAEVEKPVITNRDGYPAYERPLEEQYLQTLLTNTLGNTFYADKDELLQEATEIHDKMIQTDPEFAAKALIFGRNEGFMRLQPTFGLAKLAGVRPDLFAKVFDQVILIPSDLQDFFTILKNLRNGEGGRAVKRAAAKWLNNVSEYWAIKYSGRGRGYSLGDVVKTVHPVPKDDKQKALFAYLIGREEYDGNLLPQVTAFERLKKAETTEEKIATITEGKLPHEVVTGAVKPDKAIWNAIVHQMPVFALLRNLNTLSRAGVLEDNRQLITERLSNAEALRKAKILPFRFLKAFKEVREAWAQDVLRQAVELTFANLPEIPGKTAIFLDVSGSMSGDYLMIGAVFALALFKKTGGNCVFWLFNTDVSEIKPSLYDSILTQAEKIHADGGTDTGAPMGRLAAKRISVDNILLITDEQQNTGSPFYRNLVLYRKQVNPEAKAFVIDIAPYRSAVVPPSDQLTYYVYGWSDTVLQYISTSCRGYSDMISEVKKIPL